jgi:hypothetical protein
MQHVVAQRSLRGVKNFLMENGINFISKVQRCNIDRIIDISLSLHCFTAPSDIWRNYHQLVPESRYHKLSAFYELPRSTLHNTLVTHLWLILNSLKNMIIIFGMCVFRLPVCLSVCIGVTTAQLIK